LVRALQSRSQCIQTLPHRGYRIPSRNGAHPLVFQLRPFEAQLDHGTVRLPRRHFLFHLP
jgi:hypothetical protein